MHTFVLMSYYLLIIIFHFWIPRAFSSIQMSCFPLHLHLHQNAKNPIVKTPIPSISRFETTFQKIEMYQLSYFAYVMCLARSGSPNSFVFSQIDLYFFVFSKIGCNFVHTGWIFAFFLMAFTWSESHNLHWGWICAYGSSICALLPKMYPNKPAVNRATNSIIHELRRAENKTDGLHHFGLCFELFVSSGFFFCGIFWFFLRACGFWKLRFKLFWLFFEHHDILLFTRIRPFRELRVSDRI